MVDNHDANEFHAIKMIAKCCNYRFQVSKFSKSILTLDRQLWLTVWTANICCGQNIIHSRHCPKKSTNQRRPLPDRTIRFLSVIAPEEPEEDGKFPLWKRHSHIIMYVINSNMRAMKRNIVDRFNEVKLCCYHTGDLLSSHTLLVYDELQYQSNVPLSYQFWNRLICFKI